MNLFSLEGSGFLIAVCLTLFLSGMIVFYVRQKFNETDHKIQHMLGIVQQINSNQIPKPQDPRLSETGVTGFGAAVGGAVGGGNMNAPTNSSLNVQEFSQNEIDMNLLTNMPPIPEEREGQKISISESSEISSTTDEDVDDDVDDDVDEDVDEDDDIEHEAPEGDESASGPTDCATDDEIYGSGEGYWEDIAEERPPLVMSNTADMEAFCDEYRAIRGSLTITGPDVKPSRQKPSSSERSSSSCTSRRAGRSGRAAPASSGTAACAAAASCSS